ERDRDCRQLKQELPRKRRSRDCARMHDLAFRQMPELIHVLTSPIIVLSPRWTNQVVSIILLSRGLTMAGKTKIISIYPTAREYDQIKTYGKKNKWKLGPTVLEIVRKFFAAQQSRQEK